MDKYMVSFATEGFKIAQKVQVHNFTKLHPEGKVYAFDERIIDIYKTEFPLLLEKRGAGYWAWKYIILRDLLKAGKPGDKYFYVDSGATPIRSLDPLYEIAEPIVLFKARSPQYTYEQLSMKYWCKADTVEHFKCSPEVWEEPTYCGGYQLYTAGETALAFLEEIVESARLPQLWNDASSVSPNLPSFKEHRHDQSVLTCVAHNHGIKPHTCPNQENALAGECAEQDVSILLHRIRDSHSQHLLNNYVL